MARPVTTWDAFARNGNSSMSILRRRPGLPTCLLVCFVFAISLLGYISHPFNTRPRNLHPASKGKFESSWNYTRDAKNLKLSDAQCSQAFPDLYKEIDRAKASKSRVTLKDIDSVPIVQGYVRAMIYDQEVCL